MTRHRRRAAEAILFLGLVAQLPLVSNCSAEMVRFGKPVAGAFTFALLGDTPYGDTQRAIFPALVDAINADADVRLVLHAGDVKNGSSTCDDARFADLAQLYGTFDDPFVLTPGDNEWTDCHRTAAGGYVPTERLDAVRHVFYPRAGQTLGANPAWVLTQAYDPRHRPYRENVLFLRSRVVFATVHVVGSENDLQPWAQLPGGDQPETRLAEFEARKSAALDWIDAASEPVKIFWTVSCQLFCSWVGSLGGLIQATVGSLGGSGCRLNRSGFRA